MTDIFKEVDEDIRREQLHKLWDRFGPYVLGLAVLIVAVTAGYRGWVYWQDRQAQASGDRFLAAVQLAADGKHDDAIKALEALTKDGHGAYPTLARFRIAGEEADAGDTNGAVSEFDAIAADNSAPAEIRNMARLRAALLLVDTSTVADLKQRIGDMAATGNQWRAVAREILGLAAWRTGDLSAARQYYSDIASDVDAPNEAHQRASLMLGLIDAKLGQPAPSAAGTAGAAPPDAGAAPDAGPAATAPPAQMPATP
ncbi:MAG TPA: tetratricopeptide repeat protein [Bauldia sp.]|nr:tetratricopeptide repeat protein [Bauldia sp.]